MADELNKNLKLNEENFEVWSMKIQDLLEEQEVLDSLSLVIAKPEEGTTSQHVKDLEAYVAWRKKNSTACIILLSAMDDDIAEQFHIYDNAMDLWIALKDKFGGVSLAKLRTLALKFDTYKMRHDHTMKMHVSEMYNMMNELSDAGQEMTEEEKVRALIRSLPDRWDHMRMHLIQTESIRTFECAARHLQLEEDRLTSIKINVEARFGGPTTSDEKNSNIMRSSCSDDYDKEQAREPKKPKLDQEGKQPSMKKLKVNIRLKGSNCNESSIRSHPVLHPRSSMQIFVKTPPGRTHNIQVERSDTIDIVKAKIEDDGGLPKECQRLMFGRKLLTDDSTVADYNIQNQSTIHLVFESFTA